jgi:dipeptidyl aminopeptidase/acylaminoacyl peptidase
VEHDRGYGVLRVGPLADPARPEVEGLPHGVVADLAWAGDSGRLACMASAPTVPPGLWCWEATTGTVRPLLVPAVPALPEFRLVEWPSFDGATVAGWLALPDGPMPAPGWPALVWVHGGPAMQARPNFRPDLQSILARGIAVLVPNVRGSTGYGRAWMDADDREKRLDSVHDLAAGRNWLAAQHGIDPARIGVMGQSYGGYMVLAALTEYPALWRCAVNFYGIADFVTLLEATGPWRRAHRAAEYGDPARHRALFDRISPIHHIHRVQVPLLVLHGIRDPRVPIGESEQVVQALGEAVQYEVFDYAGHGFIRQADRERAYAAVAAFLTAQL